MLHITLSDQRPDTDHEVDGRATYGWNPDAPLADMWEDNRGVWTLGPRADSERYVAFAYRGRIVMVGTIDRIVTAPGMPGKRAIEGKALTPGDALHDALVGNPSRFSGQSKRYLDEADVIEIAFGV